VRVLFFARSRELAGTNETTVSLEDGSSTKTLLLLLFQQVSDAAARCRLGASNVEANGSATVLQDHQPSWYHTVGLWSCPGSARLNDLAPLTYAISTSSHCPCSTLNWKSCAATLCSA
jgi:molybdopterin converting factor small subunit